jgi:microcin C transport system substrate-binding protein
LGLTQNWLNSGPVNVLNIPSLWALASLVFALSLPASVHSAPGIALGAEPKYTGNWSHFSYANPNAPKGGQLTAAATGNFDKLNPFTLKGNVADYVSSLVFETLMIGSLDEPFSMYGLVAQEVELAADELSVTFRLNPQAKFSNGDAIRADDVKYSFDTLMSKEASPLWRNYWADVKQLVVVDPLTVRFDFRERNRELHMICGSVPVFSRKWGQGKKFSDVINEMPIGSGPYLVDQVDPGKGISFKRNPAYWGAQLPVRKGMYNFDRIALKYFKDEFTRIEAFKAGEFDFIQENVAKNWARNYEGPKFRDGTLVKTTLAHKNAQGLQGYVLNLRKPIFKDVRVRRALALSMDFEWMNRQLFYGQYKRSYSYFTNSEFAATGLPGPDELKYLEPLRAKLKPEVFAAAPQPPSTLAPNTLRQNLRQARALLEEAGWVYRDGALRNAKGEPFEFEILSYTRSTERLVAPMIRNLEKLGIVARQRVADMSLYKKRIDAFDYDVITHVFSSSQSPGNEQVHRFSSQSADEPGSDNMIGLKDPAVDALLEQMLKVGNKKDFVGALKALDRVLLHGHYVIPNWHNDSHRVAFRPKVKFPKTLPLYYPVPQNWIFETGWLEN